MNTMTKLTSAVLCGLALTACGGGGDSPKTRTFRYEIPDPSSYDASHDLTDLPALFSREGAKGYFYHQTSYWISSSLPFVNDGSGKTYTYKLLDVPNDITDFLTQANAEGKNGYFYEAYPFALSAYRKENGSSATYTYTSKPMPANKEDFIAQANEMGKSGFLFLPVPYYIGSSTDLVYMKNNASNATYTYHAPALPETREDFLAQFSNEGEKGYRAFMHMDYMPDRGSFLLYVKDEMQAVIFTYQSPTTDAFIDHTTDQANFYGAQGYVYGGYMYVGQDRQDSIDFYVKASNNCSGWICTAFNPVVYDRLPLCSGTTGSHVKKC